MCSPHKMQCLWCTVWAKKRFTTVFHFLNFVSFCHFDESFYVFDVYAVLLMVSFGSHALFSSFSLFIFFIFHSLLLLRTAAQIRARARTHNHLSNVTFSMTHDKIKPFTRGSKWIGSDDEKICVWSVSVCVQCTCECAQRICSSRLPFGAINWKC